MKTLAGVRYVLFDAVGTLIQPQPSVSEVYAAYGRQYGSRLTSEAIRPRFAAAFCKSTPAQATSEEFERERWRSIVREVVDDVVQRHDDLFSALWQHFGRSEHWQMFADVLPVWNELARRGFELGIASNFDARLRGVCAGLPPLCDCQRVFVSSEVGYAKPDLRFFATIAERLQTSPHELLLIGDDRERDYEAAKAAGWKGLLIDRRGDQQGEDVLRDLREVL
jgi:putative hydrolase of the HAD superfamily